MVPLDAGKELFIGELLVTKQGKLAKKALPVRAHDSRFMVRSEGRDSPKCSR